MSKTGAFDLASGVGGKIEKDDVLAAVEKYSFPFYLLPLSNFIVFVKRKMGYLVLHLLAIWYTLEL